MVISAGELEAKGQTIVDKLKKLARTEASIEAGKRMDESKPDQNTGNPNARPLSATQAAAFVNAAVANIETAAQGLPARFKWFAGPDPESLGSLAEGINSARTSITAMSKEKSHSLPNMLTKWDGASADEFKVNFMPVIPAAVGNQTVMIDQMGKHLEVAKQRATKVREDVGKLADDIIKDLKPGGMDLALVLTCLVAIGSIGVAGGLTALAAQGLAKKGADKAVLAFTWLGGGAGDGGDALKSLGENSKNLVVSGSNAAEILASINQALDKMYQVTVAIDDSLSFNMTKDLNLVKDNMESHFLPKRVRTL